MQKARAVVLIVIVTILAVLCVWQVRNQAAVARRIPDELKHKIVDEQRFFGNGGQPLRPGIVWRAYHTESDAAYLVAEWQIAPLYGTAPYTELFFYRVAVNKDGSYGPISRWSLHWRGAKFEAECSYSLIVSDDPKEQLPYEQVPLWTKELPAWLR